MNWVLLAFLYAYPSLHKVDVSMTTTRFYSQTACQSAGQEIQHRVVMERHYAGFVCIRDAESK